MAVAKRKNKSSDKRNMIIACVGTIAVITASAFAVRAYLQAQTNEIENRFSPMTYTNIQIYESTGQEYTLSTSSPTITKNAVIQNPARHNQKPVYIRAQVVTVVREGDLNVSADHNYTISGFTPATGWTKGTDGYYYYTSPVDPGGETTDLFGGTALKIMNGKTQVTELPDGITVEVQVIADAVQAVEVDHLPDAEKGETWANYYTDAPAKDAWGTGIPALTVLTA